jgi:hypothetical protein
MFFAFIAIPVIAVLLAALARMESVVPSDDVDDRR